MVDVYDETRLYRALRNGKRREDEALSNPVSPMVEVEGAALASRSPPPSPTALRVGSDGLLNNLRELLALLKTTNGIRLLKKAYRDNMAYKIEKYSKLLAEADKEVGREKEVLQLKIPELKQLANVKDDTDNWSIFESVSEGYKQAKARSASFEAILVRARDRMRGSMAFEPLEPKDVAMTLRDELAANLLELTNFSFTQPQVVKKVVDIVDSFLKDPRLFRKKMLNIMLLGSAGTGKTTLAEVIGKVFASSGIFVSGEVITAGRSELVGQYEGQTVARTRNFLLSNLDNGVVFIDEAYAITPWDKGKPEGYGSEAATAMVEFMTQYQGLYCIIVAGYEKQMTRYFLATNEGLNRRFPHKFVLEDMTATDLLLVFKRKLLEFQGLHVPNGRTAFYDSTNYFDEAAWDYLVALLAESTKGETFVDPDGEYDDSTRKQYTNVKVFLPSYPLVYTLFEAQAGAMANLADEAVTVLMTKVTYADVLAATKKGAERAPFKTQGVDVMREIVRQRIRTSALSLAEQVLQELEEVEGVIAGAEE